MIRRAAVATWLTVVVYRTLTAGVAFNRELVLVYIATGLVAHRKTTGKGGSSVYVLTPNGRSLSKLLTALYDWGPEHARAYNVRVGEPLKILTAKN